MQPLCTTRMIISVIFVAVVLFLVIGAFLWLDKLHKSKDCACSEDWKRSFLRVFLAFYIIILIVNAVYALYYMFTLDCAPHKRPMWLQAILAITGMATFVYIIVAIQYVKQLKEKKCECARSGSGDDKLIAHVAIMLTIIAIVVIALLGMMIAIPFMFGRALKKETMRNLRK